MEETKPNDPLIAENECKGNGKKENDDKTEVNPPDGGLMVRISFIFPHKCQ